MKVAKKWSLGDLTSPNHNPSLRSSCWKVPNTASATALPARRKSSPRIWPRRRRTRKSEAHESTRPLSCHSSRAARRGTAAVGSQDRGSPWTRAVPLSPVSSRKPGLKQLGDDERIEQPERPEEPQGRGKFARPAAHDGDNREEDHPQRAPPSDENGGLQGDWPPKAQVVTTKRTPKCTSTARTQGSGREGGFQLFLRGIRHGATGRRTRAGSGRRAPRNSRAPSIPGRAARGWRASSGPGCRARCSRVAA